MRIGRTLPPAAAQIYLKNIIRGFIGIFRGNREIERFRSEIKEYFGAKYCFLTSSGTASLAIILKALHALKPDRDEVLLPAYTCFSVPSAVARAGLKVRLCDINRENLNFEDTCLLKYANTKSQNTEISDSLQSNRLLTVIASSLFGLPTNAAKLRNLFSESDIVVIEDAAQAMGVFLGTKMAGSIGDVGFFSLGRGKSISTVEGGVIITDNEQIAERIESEISRLPSYNLFDQLVIVAYAIAINIFMRPFLFWIPKSLTFLKLGETSYDENFKIKKMSPFQAGLAFGWQKKLKHFMRIRKKKSDYLKLKLRLDSNGKKSNTTKSEFQTFNHIEIENAHDFAPIRFPMIVHDKRIRFEILGQSEKMGLGIMGMYPYSVNRIPDIKNQFEGQSFPVAESIARNIITLPVHTFVSNNDYDKIAMMFERCLKYNDKKGETC